MFSITTSLCNDILDGSANEDSVNKTISNLEKMLASEDIELYYFERGAVYSAVDDSSKTQLQLVQTEKQDLDSTVYRCNCIGYNIKKLDIRRPAKVVLYKFHDNSPVETNEDQYKDESKTNSDQDLTDSLKNPICGDSKQQSLDNFSNEGPS